MSRSTQSQHDDRGVVALELVLALPVLLMLISGAVIAGAYMSQVTQTMGFAHHAAREAALYQDLPDGASFFNSSACDQRFPNTDVTVQVTQTVRFTSIPLIPIDIVPATIKREATMRCGG